MGDTSDPKTGQLDQEVDLLENDMFSEQNDILERAFPAQFQSWNKLWYPDE